MQTLILGLLIAVAAGGRVMRTLVDLLYRLGAPPRALFIASSTPPSFRSTSANRSFVSASLSSMLPVSCLTPLRCAFVWLIFALVDASCTFRTFWPSGKRLDGRQNRFQGIPHKLVCMISPHGPVRQPKKSFVPTSTVLTDLPSTH
jgi:hypothetical protein